MLVQHGCQGAYLIGGTLISQSKQQYAMVGLIPTKDQFAKIFIVSDDNTFVAYRPS